MELIREATAADLPAIVGLLADDVLGASREGPALDPAYQRAFAAIAADPNQALMVMERAGRVIACMQISYLPGISQKGMWRGQIEHVRVASDMRNQGLGHTLIGWAVEQCRARGCGVVQLTTHLSRTDAHRFYKDLGFEHSHAGMKLKL